MVERRDTHFPDGFIPAPYARQVDENLDGVQAGAALPPPAPMRVCKPAASGSHAAVSVSSWSWCPSESGVDFPDIVSAERLDI
jgi:hypothetical protein